MFFFKTGDRNWVESTTDEYQIRGHVFRGYVPWYTLWTRKTFWKWSWWSFDCWADNKVSLEKAIDRYKQFDAGNIPN